MTGTQNRISKLAGPRKRKLGPTILLFVLAVAIVVLWPAASSAGRNQESSTLRVAVGSIGNQGFDPTIERLQGMGAIGAPIYDWLAWPKADGSPGPGIASSWVEAKDHLSWTLTLRSDLKFSNGDPLTAKDVRYSLQRQLNPAALTTQSPLWQTLVKGVTMLSPTKIRINLKSPFAYLPVMLLPTMGPQASVVNSKEASKNPKAYFANPIGSGPWRFASQTPGVGVSYTKNPQAHPYRKSPGFDNLRITVVPDGGSRVAQLKSGALDIAEVAPSDVRDLGNRGFRITAIPDYQEIVLQWFGLPQAAEGGMCQGKPLVRQALSLAVDRKLLVRSFLRGYGKVTPRTIIAPGTPGFDPKWKLPEHNVARAKQLLTQAGCSSFTFTLWQAPLPGAAFTSDMAPALAAMWAQIGVTARVIPKDYASITQEARVHPHRPEMTGTMYLGTAPSSPIGAPWYKGFFPTTSVGWGLPTPRMDALVAKIDAAKTVNELIPAMRAASDYVHSQWQNEPIVLVPTLFAVSPNVKGWTSTDHGVIGLNLESARR